ncbi:MFS transporter [Arachnia propionica]|uniref:MFS transporter n=1 Tax=Arachnia propionica TaxID=1750 RepID=UPI003C6EB8F6
MSRTGSAATAPPRQGTGNHSGSEFPAGLGTVTALVVTALAVLSQLYAAIPLLTPVGEALGGSATFALSTGYGLCYAVGFLLWGPVADRYGRRRVMLIGLCLLVSTTLACGLTVSLPALALARGAQGLMASSFPPVALAYLSEAVAPRHRTTAIGAMSTAFLVAGITGQIGAQAITQRFGWPWVFLGSTCLLTICALAVAWLTRDHHRTPVTGGPGGQFLAIARLLARGDVLCLCGAHLTLLLSFVAMYTGLGLHLTTSGHGPGEVFLIRLAGLPGMFVALAAGPLGRLLGGDAGLARAGFLIAAAGLAAEALTPGALLGLGATSLLFVVGIALAVPAMINLFGQASAPRRGSGMAVNGFILFIGASLGPVLATAGLGFPILLLILAMLLGTAAALVTFSAHLVSRKNEVVA